MCQMRPRSCHTKVKSQAVLPEGLLIASSGQMFVHFAVEIVTETECYASLHQQFVVSHDLGSCYQFCQFTHNAVALVSTHKVPSMNMNHLLRIAFMIISIMWRAHAVQP